MAQWQHVDAITMGSVQFQLSKQAQGLANTPVVGPVVKEKLAMLPGMKENRVNTTVKMDCAKVVDTVDIEDMGDKGVFCRCWKSKKFPYCDGSHNKHNQVTGDNVGPLIIKK